MTKVYGLLPVAAPVWVAHGSVPSPAGPVTPFSSRSKIVPPAVG